MITFDSFGQSNETGTGAGTTPWAFNNVGGNFLVLVCAMDTGGGAVTDATYAGEPLTQLHASNNDGAGLYVGYLANPAKGSNNIATLFSGGVTAYRTGVITFSGVNTNNPIGGSNSTSTDGVGTPITTIVTVQGTEGIVIDGFANLRVTTGNVTSPQVEKMNNQGLWGAGVNHLAGMSYLSHAGSNITMSWENLTGESGSTHKILYAVEILPSTFIPQIQII